MKKSKPRRTYTESEKKSAIDLYVGGKTITEVSSATGISVPYMKTLVRRAEVGRPSGFQKGNLSRTGKSHSEESKSKMRQAHIESGHKPSREAISKSHRSHHGDPLSQLMGRYQRSAKSRGLEFLLSKAQFESIVSENCSYCGDPPSRRKSTSLSVNEVDRIDNTLGYRPENCCSACRACNWMKGGESLEFFVLQCQKVSKHRTENGK